MATKTSRPRLSFLIAAAFALSASVMPTKVKAADLYFDGAAGGTYPSFFSNPANWTDASSNPAFPSLTGDSLFFGYGSAVGANALIVSNLGSGYTFSGVTFADFDGLGSRQLAGGGVVTVCWSSRV